MDVYSPSGNLTWEVFHPAENPWVQYVIAITLTEEFIDNDRRFSLQCFPCELVGFLIMRLDLLMHVLILP